MHAVDKGARAPNDFEVGVFVVLVEVAYFIAHGDSIRRVFQELALFPVQFEFLTGDSNSNPSSGGLVVILPRNLVP